MMGLGLAWRWFSVHILFRMVHVSKPENNIITQANTKQTKTRSRQPYVCSSVNVMASTSKRNGATWSRWVQQQNGRIPRLWTTFKIDQKSCQCCHKCICLYSCECVSICVCLLFSTRTWVSVVLILGMMQRLLERYWFDHDHHGQNSHIVMDWSLGCIEV